MKPVGRHGDLPCWHRHSHLEQHAAVGLSSHEHRWARRDGMEGEPVGHLRELELEVRDELRVRGLGGSTLPRDRPGLGKEAKIE